MSRFLVISRCNEDCGWIQNNFRTESIIYNHGKELQNRFLNIKPCIQGSDLKAFLTYIVDWYDQLADVTHFLTANLPAYLEKKSRDDSSIPKDVKTAIDKLTKEAQTNGISQNYGNHGNTELMQKYVLPGKSYGLSYGEWFYQYFGFFPETKFKSLPSCCFAVRKDHIHQRPIEFYRHLLQQMSADYGETRTFLSQSWYYVFQLWQSCVPDLPENIGVVCYGVSKVPYLDVPNEQLYTIDAAVSLHMISKYVLEPLKKQGKQTTVYFATNAHGDVKNYSEIVEAQYVKTKDGMNSNTAWNDTRRLFPKLWYDHAFLIAIHLDVVLLQPIDKWSIDPVQLNYEGSMRQIQAFSTSATSERRILPSFVSQDDTKNQLFTSIVKRLPARK